MPGCEAPVSVPWARTTRSALIRVPAIRGGNTAATRIELRCPDPSCNPYLAFAAMLAAGTRAPAAVWITLVNFRCRAP